jgi:hypothetical protein
MAHRIAFLLGAGASFGASTGTNPYPPPLMRELYDRLAAQFPEEWGAAGPLAKHSDAFRDNFEEAFTEFFLKMPRDRSLGFTPPTLNLLEGQRTLAIYFSQFTLDAAGADCYSNLIRAVKNAGVLSLSTFGSLNYDCLMEQAAYTQGISVDYTCASGAPNQIRVAKIHGSCNFVTPTLSQHDRALLAAPHVRYEHEFEYLSTVGLEVAVKEALSGVEALHLPIMSQISPRKEHLIAPVKIQEYRNRWREQTLAADAVAIIGVSYNANDEHITSTIRSVSAPIYYIGDAKSLAKWHADNALLEPVHTLFNEGLPLLLDRLRLS